MSSIDSVKVVGRRVGSPRGHALPPYLLVVLCLFGSLLHARESPFPSSEGSKGPILVELNKM